MTSVKTAIVFPGQGSQRPGMLAAVPELDALDRLLDAAEALSGLELRTIASLGGADDLADTRVAQPLLYLADWAWGTTLLQCGVEPFALAGHSLGEFAALALADVFSVEAGLELVVERSKLMAATAASTPGGMLAVLGLDASLIAHATAGIEGIWIANDNAPGQVIVSGTEEALSSARSALAEAGARRLLPLQVAGAFHSPLMAPAADAFAEVLQETAFCDAQIPVVQNTDPRPNTDAEAIRVNLVAQMVAPVRWAETMQRLSASGPVAIIEAGPGGVLAGLAKRIEGITALSVQESSLEAILEEVS